jgi:hypothetical protein
MMVVLGSTSTTEDTASTMMYVVASFKFAPTSEMARLSARTMLLEGSSSETK